MKDVYHQILDCGDDVDRICELQQFQEHDFRLSPLTYWRLVCDVYKEKVTKLQTVADKFVSGDLPPTSVKLLNLYQEIFDFAEKRFLILSNNSGKN